MADTRDAASEAAASSSASQSRMTQEERAIPAPRQTTSKPEDGGDRLPKPAQLSEATEAEATHGARDELALASAAGTGKQEREQRALGSTHEAETAASREAIKAGAGGEADDTLETAQASSQAAAPAGDLVDAPTSRIGALRSETRPVSKVSDGGQQPAAPAADAVQDAGGSSGSGAQGPSSRAVITGAENAQASESTTAQAVSSPLVAADVSQTPRESFRSDVKGGSAASAEHGAIGASQEPADSVAPGRPQEGARGLPAVKGPAATGEGGPQLLWAQVAQSDLPSEQGQHPITPATEDQHTGISTAAREPGCSAEAAEPPSDSPSRADCTSTPFAAAAQAGQPVSGCYASKTGTVTSYSACITCIGQCKLVSRQCCLWCRSSHATFLP